MNEHEPEKQVLAPAAGPVPGAVAEWDDDLGGVDDPGLAALDAVAVPIEDGDTEETLHERIKVVERRLLVSTLAPLAAEVGGAGRTHTSDFVGTFGAGCGPGEVAVGGGYKMEGEPLTRTVLQNRPDTDHSGWLVQQSPAGPLTLYVVCIK